MKYKYILYDNAGKIGNYKTIAEVREKIFKMINHWLRVNKKHLTLNASIVDNKGFNIIDAYLDEQGMPCKFQIEILK